MQRSGPHCSQKPPQLVNKARSLVLDMAHAEWTVQLGAAQFLGVVS